MVLLKACLRIPKRHFQTVPSFIKAKEFPKKIALTDGVASYSYANLFLSAKELAVSIRSQLDGKTNKRVMFLTSNNADYVVSLWAIWMAGHTAVPLSPLHPKSILLYYANDTQSSLLITTEKFVELTQRISQNTNTKLYVLDGKFGEKVMENGASLDSLLPTEFYSNTNALILYTSGTTGNPKGVVLTHRNLSFQVNTLLTAWKWAQTDTILHTLPLHHVHGIVNALLCPLQIGAKIIMLPKFEANSVWSHILGVNVKQDERRMSVYMAVPTIYSKLIDEYDRVFRNDPKMVDYIRSTLKQKVRLMVSGSAPLPLTVYQKWLDITGHRLLERYGMTETGMSLSNAYTSDRETGFVGLPLPGVSVKLIDDRNECKIQNKDGTVICHKNDFENTSDISGELYVKSDGVFKEYLNKPEATKNSFDVNGWFKTGDLCLYDNSKKCFKILGRKSSDIIKCGGYKLSAIEIETVLLAHPDIKECVVVGLDDEKWGQKVGAVVVLKNEKGFLDINGLRDWCLEQLPKYSLPSVLEIVPQIARNAMGKVNRNKLVQEIFKLKD